MIIWSAMLSRLTYILTLKVNCTQNWMHRWQSQYAIGHWHSSFKTGTPTISFGVPVFEQWPLKRYIISLVVLSTDARGFILVDQITYYCSFVNRRSIGRLSIKLTVTYSLLIIEIFIHPVKTLLQHYGKSLEALPGVAYPGFRDNRSTLNTKTGF